MGNYELVTDGERRTVNVEVSVRHCVVRECDGDREGLMARVWWGR